MSGNDLGGTQSNSGGTPSSTSGLGEGHWSTGEAYKGIEGGSTLSKFTSPTDAVKAYVELEKKYSSVNKGGTAPFSKPNTLNEYKEVASKYLGLPEKGKYSVDVPEDFKYVSPEFKEKMKETFHDLGILPEQAKGLFGTLKDYGENVTGGITKETAESKLKSWEEYNKQFKTDIERSDHFNKAKQAYDTLVDEETRNKLKERGITDAPELTKIFAKLYDLTNSDNIDGGLQNTPLSNPMGSVEEISKKLYEIRMDLYTNGNTMAIDKRASLNAEIDRLTQAKVNLQSQLKNQNAINKMS